MFCIPLGSFGSGVNLVKQLQKLNQSGAVYHTAVVMKQAHGENVHTQSESCGCCLYYQDVQLSSLSCTVEDPPLEKSRDLTLFIRQMGYSSHVNWF